MNKLEVQNNEDSNSDDIKIVEVKDNKKEITVEKITGKNYVGYVMIIQMHQKLIWLMDENQIEVQS